MQAVLEALVEPRRRDILRLVRDGELAAGAIAERFPDVARPTVSQHLRVLRGAGLLVERRDGTRRFYRARPDALAELRAFVEDFWDARPADIHAAAEEEQGDGATEPARPAAVRARGLRARGP